MFPSAIKLTDGWCLFKNTCGQGKIYLKKHIKIQTNFISSLTQCF